MSPKLIPQIVINYRRHNAVGLQPTMMMLWAWAGVPLGVYNIVEEFNVALRIQPQILTFLSLVTWIQCFYYEKVLPSSSLGFEKGASTNGFRRRNGPSRARSPLWFLSPALWAVSRLHLSLLCALLKASTYSGRLLSWPSYRQHYSQPACSGTTGIYMCIERCAVYRSYLLASMLLGTYFLWYPFSSNLPWTLWDW